MGILPLALPSADGGRTASVAPLARCVADNAVRKEYDSRGPGASAREGAAGGAMPRPEEADMAKADDTTTTPEYEQFRELFTRRMSIRDLRPDPVPDAYVDRILEARRWPTPAPNSHPSQFIAFPADP